MALRTSRRRTALTGLLAALALPTVTLAAPAFAAPAAPPAPPSASVPAAAKIEAKVLDQLADDDKAVYWVQLNSQATTVEAQRATTKTAKAEALLRAKTTHADTTQAHLRGLLDAVRADYRSYWIVNAIRVTGDRKLLDTLAQQPEVASIRAEQTVKLDEVIPATAEPKAADAVEWNVDRIGAPRVWDELGDRGEGIVVANIDSGVDYTHPAVNAQYRGRSADGAYDHNYNWFDPANVCPSAAPCDNNDHGTHTMGTMVGSAGADRIGVAPGARWIAAKGCETNSCSDASLLAAGQWVIAPTDLSGNNPRPDLAPDVVNNSWGGTLYDDWYRLTVQAWVDAGIFPAFSNGNSGPGCNSNGYPGGYTNGYSSGSFNSAGAISSFSSRGPGESGQLKPDLAAPGENVRSSVPGAGYAAFSGTSMASPHTAATVALIWAYAPSLRGNVAETRALLDRTAVDTDATACGGTAAKNNIFGEGKLDAYAAVSAAPHGPVGTLAGHVTSGGAALAGATVFADGAIDRTAVTGADGSYSLANLAEGSYSLKVTKYGYLPATADAVVVADQTVTRDFAVEQAPSAVVTGTVRSGGVPAAGSVVTATGTPVSATADAAGHYRLTLPLGEYDVTASSPYRCADQAQRHLSLTGDTTADIELPVRTDTFGYSCAAGGGDWVGGTTKLALTGDTAAEQVRLPFAVPLYGNVYTSGYVSTDGVFSFPAASTLYSNGAIPSPGLPNGALYPLWDDLYLDANSGVYTATTGTGTDRAFVVEWRNVTFYSDRTVRLSFSVAIGEDGSFTYRYKDTAAAGPAAGSGATVGLENATGTDALQYSLNTAVLTDGLAVTFRPVKTGLLRGTVTDANDGKPLAGAAVKLLTAAGATAGTATSGEDGGYVLQPAAGDYRLETGAANYATATGPVTVTAGAVQRPVTALATGRVASSVPALTAVVPAGQTRTRTFELANSGAPTAYTVTEAVDAAWLKVEPAAGDLGTGGRQTVKLSLDTAGSAPGTVLTAQLLIRSASGRAPQLTVPVTVVVPGYQVALDAGAIGGFTDSLGDSWTKDREYASGGYGYQGKSSAKDTREAITGSTDPKRFQTAREGMYGYAFDHVPNGVYTVELDFAELDRKSPNTRVFDVLIEDREVIPDLDIALKVGSRKALTQSFTVTVTDGRLDVRFVAANGKTLLNAIRVTQRPDLTG
ncbi:S8 family serine peptidase [Kitasatospora sp. NBC_00070]|uniref:S8 family serine peptidase n=1 Tax=Kitasatospora sp. NBC_00070 TaxID=2975962 RepID=UPI003243C77E